MGSAKMNVLNTLCRAATYAIGAMERYREKGPGFDSLADKYEQEAAIYSNLIGCLGIIETRYPTF